MTPYDTLVLSGNSTNAMATLGTLQKLFEDKIITAACINAYYATSSGTIIATLLSIGFDPLEILAHVCINRSYQKVLGSLNISLSGLLNFDIIERELDNIIVTQLGYLPTLNCIRERMGKYLSFVTYNLSTGQKEYLTPDTYPDLIVTKAIRMSSTFPFIFEPYEYNGNYYLDGGVVENFPLMKAQLDNRKCLGVYNNNLPKPYTQNMNYFELFARLLTTLISAAADVIPVMPGSKKLKLSYPSSFFNFASPNCELIRMFDMGYDICTESLKDL